MFFKELVLDEIQKADDIIALFLQPEPRLQHRWILVRKADSLKLGTCGFHCWDKLKCSCDVGYDLYPDFWGKGYMREAVQAIITIVVCMDKGTENNPVPLVCVESGAFYFPASTESIHSL